MTIEVLSSETVRTKGGIRLCREIWRHEGGKTPMTVAYSTTDGSYVGDWKDAKFLLKREIIPQKAHPHNTVASIGFCASEQKWYGWSHRAIFGYGVGSRIEPDTIGSTDDLPVGFTAQTLDDAKRMAIAFADSVA